MHPKELRELLDHVSEAYASLYDRVGKLQRDVKELHEDSVKRRPAMQYAPAPGWAESSLPPAVKRIIKMGADWYMEGQTLADEAGALNLSLVQLFKFPGPICNAKISEGGQVAFTCNKRVFLWRNGVFYMMEDAAREFDPAMMKNDLSDNYRCVFDFDGEDLVVCYRGLVVKYADNKKVWTLQASGVLQLQVEDGMLYLVTRDMKVLVFQELRHGEVKFLRAIDTVEPVKGMRLVGSDILVYNDHKIWTIGKGYANENMRIMAVDVSKDMAYYGGESGVLKVARAAPAVELIDTIVIKKNIYAVKAWNKFVLVATQDKALSVWDVAERKCCRIVGNDNVIDISANKDMICCVDNNGHLRIWQRMSR
ncbi:hypothetical protein PAPHI01_1956 [Pancytospora philotis]|nr:hypothetical protein PAPHI01_1956 [Pancytospora philotis]